MLRRRRRPRVSADPEPALELGPLIDIVFNLLVFFMCATKFRTAEGAIEAYLPRSSGPAAAHATRDTSEVRIRLRRVASPGGEVAVRVVLEGERLDRPGELAAAPFPEVAPVWGVLGARLVALRDAYQGADKGLPVIIDAAPDVPTKLVIAALNEVVRAGIADVTFAMPGR